MNVGILGCGWLGERIAKALLQNQYTIFTSNTSQSKAQLLKDSGCNSFVIDFSKNHFSPSIQEKFRDLDCIIISVKMAKNADEDKQNQIFKNIAKFLKNYQGKVILFSTTGIYPQENQNIAEDTFSKKVLHSTIYVAEQIIKKALSQTNIFRLSGLMGDNRLLNQWYQNSSQIKNPNAPVNYVHYTDIVEIIQKMMQTDIQGEIFNIVAPKHPTKIEVYTKKETHSQNQGRIINGNKLQQMLNYQYSKPNPIYFE